LVRIGIHHLTKMCGSERFVCFGGLGKESRVKR
jgi:hypothetical protein